jgi:hypothetical protein
MSDVGARCDCEIKPKQTMNKKVPHASPRRFTVSD